MMKLLFCEQLWTCGVSVVFYSAKLIIDSVMVDFHYLIRGRKETLAKDRITVAGIIPMSLGTET